VYAADTAPVQHNASLWLTTYSLLQKVLEGLLRIGSAAVIHTLLADRFYSRFVKVFHSSPRYRAEANHSGVETPSALVLFAHIWPAEVHDL
jgi:hypothetical protein